MRTIREYLRVLLPLMATLGLYQFFAVPIIEPKLKPKADHRSKRPLIRKRFTGGPSILGRTIGRIKTCESSKPKTESFYLRTPRS